MFSSSSNPYDEIVGAFMVFSEAGRRREAPERATGSKGFKLTHVR
jgi:hypothetical protein